MLCNVIRFVNFLIFATLPIYELVIGSTYRDQVDCVTDIVSILTWLIVKGSVGLFVVIFLSVLVTSKNDCCIGLATIFAIPFYLAYVFSFAWLIIGSVVFWRDCSHLSPRPVNTMMWCSLTIGYVSVYLQWVTSNKKNDDD